MARIITISVREEDAWIIEKAREHGGLSTVFSEGAKIYLAQLGIMSRPYWYIEGMDYRDKLSLEERKALVQYGYQELCHTCHTPLTIGQSCTTCPSHP